MTGAPATGPSIAVVLPCLNEALSIAGVIEGFRQSLPEAAIYVVDNGSSDGTQAAALAAGAKVLSEAERGKGNAMRRAFAAIDADIYVVCDGDGTYDAAAAADLLARFRDDHLDMLVASRRKVSDGAYRAGHEWGNRLFNWILRKVFRSPFNDVFSGYRILSKRYVKSFPAQSDAFEIETEMTVHALLLRMPVAEVEGDYASRVAGSHSKLSTYRDGARILFRIVTFLRQYKPLVFFSILAGVLFGAALSMFWPVFTAYLATGQVPRIPTLVVAIGLGIVSVVMFTIGLVLDAISTMRLEIRRLLYLAAGDTRR
jgi:glycosyltransferase involved in cell wall biosynthesis